MNRKKPQFYNPDVSFIHSRFRFNNPGLTISNIIFTIGGRTGYFSVQSENKIFYFIFNLYHCSLVFWPVYSPFSTAVVIDPAGLNNFMSDSLRDFCFALNISPRSLSFKKVLNYAICRDDKMCWARCIIIIFLTTRRRFSARKIINYVSRLNVKNILVLINRILGP